MTKRSVLESTVQFSAFMTSLWLLDPNNAANSWAGTVARHAALLPVYGMAKWVFSASLSMIDRVRNTVNVGRDVSSAQSPQEIMSVVMQQLNALPEDQKKALMTMFSGTVASSESAAVPTEKAKKPEEKVGVSFIKPGALHSMFGGVSQKTTTGKTATPADILDQALDENAREEAVLAASLLEFDFM